MNKQQALNAFWSDFGVLAFEENSVPDDKAIQSLIDAGVAPSKFPYITYQVMTGELDDVIVATASIWDRSTSWETADLLANTISRRINDMSIVRFDGGGLFVSKGTPYSQHMSEEGDSAIRRVILNVGLQFFTNE